jgi:23S rRNA (cytidine1920-2'-O)/16S rRNA (cytidine1409-2'-O)-methyltransferase
MKKRLDILVAGKENISREKAQALIMSGSVFVRGKISDKSGTTYEDGVEIEIKARSPYVSRGALKLKKAVEDFKIDLSEKVICDVGASTGGFTDYSLQKGAKKVYAIDTGYGQIDQRLRGDKRVILFEKTNIKNVESLPEKIDLFVVDVSFISLKQVLPACQKINKNAEIVALIKPQFEVGKVVADKTRGVIRDKKIQTDIVENIGKFSEGLGYKTEGIIESPITGAKGNVEFLIYLRG